MRWVVVTGGVLSGLGKGILSSSLGVLFPKNTRICTIKCDGYLNIDPGTMNPIEHGEVFVLDDGGEVDMDFGHYERFLDITAKRTWSITMGKVYESIINKERQGKFLGKTVQLLPHVVEEIKNKFKEVARKAKVDVCIIEIGGTVGDIENELFIHAVRQMKLEKENMFFVHLTFVPEIKVVGEQKSKPTQQSVSLLLERGVQPDMIMCRADREIDNKIKGKIALFANINKEQVVSAPDLSSVYMVPLLFQKQGVHSLLKKRFGFKQMNDLRLWKQRVKNLMNKNNARLTVALCGKYTELKDSYASINEALIHCSALLGANIRLKLVETTNLGNVEAALKDVDAVVVPGGFGSRGVEGIIKCTRYCRTQDIPFLGLCFGLQLAVVEFARNVLGLDDANTIEVDSRTKNPVITLLDEQKKITKKGGTMRLGSYPALLKKDSLISKVYGNSIKVFERHRHRYEVNPGYHKLLEDNGLIISGLSPDRTLAEFIEVSDCSYFVATQAHPELKSRFLNPAPLFVSLIKAALRKSRSN